MTDETTPICGTDLRAKWVRNYALEQLEEVSGDDLDLDMAVRLSKGKSIFAANVGVRVAVMK